MMTQLWVGPLHFDPNVLLDSNALFETPAPNSEGTILAILKYDGPVQPIEEEE